VPYRPVAKLFYKQRTFLGNGFDKHIPAATNTHATIELLLEKGCFLCGPCRDVITRTVGAMSSFVRRRPAGNGFSTEAEESKLLRVVTKKWVGKTIKGWRRLSM
jgi:hypothetical protein